MPERRRGYLSSGSGFVSVTVHDPVSAANGAVLLVPPFGEEMNRCRRILATLGRRLATRGLMAVYFDFRGTGDSSGALQDVTAEDWIDDLLAVRNEVAAQGAAPSAVVAVRFGALIAAAASARAALAPRVVAWQPMHHGEDQLRELAQQRSLGDRLKGLSLASADEHLAALRAGSALEAGGYRITPAMANSLGRLRLGVASRQPQDCFYLMSKRNPVAERNPGGHSGCLGRVRTMMVEGPAFWLQAETPQPDELLRATEQIILG